MTSPRQLAHGPLGRLLARVLIIALVAGLLPADARASVRASKPSIDSYILTELTYEAPASTEDVLVCVVVLVVTDPSGLTKSAFGELLSHTGSDPQPYAFTGEPLDPNSGFQYHRARWMDPRVGRFAGIDPFAGRIGDPQSLHRYSYAGVSPVSNVDPSGRDFVTTLAVAAIVGIIATMAIVQFGSPRSQRWGLFGGGLRVMTLSWRSEFTFGDERLTSSEIDLLKVWTYQTVHQAYSGMGVVISEGASVPGEVDIVQSSPQGYAGATLFLSGRSEVYYDTLATHARSFASPGMPREEIVAGLGRGIGATAAHEFAHQLMNPHMDQQFDAGAYDYYSSERASQYYGALHWSQHAYEYLSRKLAY